MLVKKLLLNSKVRQPYSLCSFIYFFALARPLQPPIINCTMSTFPYVREQGDLTCTCTALDIGIPRGRLIGYYGGQRLNTSNFGDKYLNFGKRSLSRADDATPVKCTLDWATQDTDDRSTNFTLRIACKI